MVRYLSNKENYKVWIANMMKKIGLNSFVSSKITLNKKAQWGQSVDIN